MAGATSLFGAKIYICTTAQTANLNQSGYEALDWVLLTKATSKSQLGDSEEVLQEPLLSGAPARAKALITPSDPTITLVHDHEDAGEAALKAASLTDGSYAFKFDMTDAPSSSETNSIYYNRGLVPRLTQAEGGASSMDMRETTIGMQDFWLEVEPETIP